MMPARSRRGRGRRPGKPLPVQALYSVAALARAVGMSHRRLQRLLRVSEIGVLQMGKFLFVPLTELEGKLPTLWESIQAAETLRGALDDP